VADNNFRSDRDRDPLSRDSVFQSDPLAELARLIGQTDAYAEPEPRARHEEERYAPPPPPPLRPAPPQRDYQQESAPDRYFSGPATAFNGFRDDEVYNEPSAPRSQAYVPGPAAVPQSYGADEPEYHDEAEYAEDDYYEEAPAPRRRSGLIAVMAILALAVVGTAGAFGYRAMFGGSVLPTLPPIIKASNGPNKIVPAGNDAQANAANPRAAASGGSGENLVSREEQPVNMEPPKPARVVSTIPIVTGQSSAPGSVAPASGAAAAPNSPWPPSPLAAPAPQSAAPMPAAPATQAQGDAKKVHTVIIRSDQTGASEAAPAQAPPTSAASPAARTAPRPPATPRTSAIPSEPPPAGSNAPLSIVPGGETAPAAAPRTRVAAAPTSIATGGTTAAAAASGGGYAVQVTSQRSEAEAQASFRELQAKYPNQLSGREPIIRRADLGDKGTYYRALVGPFASAEQAAGLCSGLKAAGGSCLVQKN
jgi:SPOR domain